MLRCPVCDGGDLSVTMINIDNPTDELVTLRLDPLGVLGLDGGGGEILYLTLFVHCPRCAGKRGEGGIYLHLNFEKDGYTRVCWDWDDVEEEEDVEAAERRERPRPRPRPRPRRG